MIVETNKNVDIVSKCNGKVMVIKPCDSSIAPLFCPCCDFPMKSYDDSVSYRKVGVCQACNDRWTNKPGVIWPNGPNKKTKEWKEYIETRAKLFKTIITLK